MPILILTYSSFYIQHNIQLLKENWGLESLGATWDFKLDCLDSGVLRKKKKKAEDYLVLFVFVNNFLMAAF